MKSGVKAPVQEHQHTEHCNHDHEHEHHHTPQTYVRPHPKVGRNDPCPCGSGKRYKQCCLD